MLEESSAAHAAVTLGNILPNLDPLPPVREAATLDNALPKLAWWLEHDPGLESRAAWALDATGFVNGALTGVPVMDSITAGDYVLPGVDSPLPLPEPLEPTATAGELLPEWAARLDLPAGLPVIAGTYDSFADIAAAGVRGPGDAGLVLGSTMIIGRATEAAIDPPEGLAWSAYTGTGLLLGGWTLCGGLGLDWSERLLGADEDLTRAAADVEPGALLALPYLAGERTPLWDPAARGAFVGLSPATGPAELHRALVDSLALAVLDHAERLERALGPCPAWRVTGGGVRHPVWPQATADALGVPLQVVPHAADAVGPALFGPALGGSRPAATGPSPRWSRTRSRRRSAQPASALPRAVGSDRARRFTGWWSQPPRDSRDHASRPPPRSRRPALESLPVPEPEPGEVLVRVDSRRCRPRARWKMLAPCITVLSTSKNAAAVGSAGVERAVSTSAADAAASPASTERCCRSSGWRCRSGVMGAILGDGPVPRRWRPGVCEDRAHA